jgi:hypothetical protein
MPERPLEEAREQRNQDEIVVDAYGPEEQATGWHASLEPASAPSPPGGRRSRAPDSPRGRAARPAGGTPG